MLSRGKAYVVSGIKARKKYFKEEKEHIAKKNIEAIEVISIITAIIVGIFIGIAKTLYPSWELTIQYIIMEIVFLAVGTFTAWYRRKEIDPLFVKVYTSLFAALLLGMLMVIEVFPYPDATCAFIPIIMVVIPVVFIFEYEIVLPGMTIAEVVFVTLCRQYKTPYACNVDIFNSILGLISSYVVTVLIMRIRLEEGDAKSHLRKIGSEDVLTGLLNKYSCEKNIIEYLQYRDLDSFCGLILLDIDCFKDINDKMGHQVGDIVLSAVGKTLRGIFRSSDIVGRVGGDEFMIMMRNMSDVEQSKKKCMQIQKELSHIVISEEKKWTVSCSIGCIILREDSVGFDMLYQKVDEALYESKEKGRDCFTLYQMDTTTAKRNMLVIADDSAMVCDTLKEIFDPEYDIATALDGKETLDILIKYAEQIAVLILDLNMPQKHGFDILQYMRDHDELCHIPVLVITSDEDCELKSLELGADDMLYKPLIPEVVRLRVRNLVRGRSY